MHVGFLLSTGGDGPGGSLTRLGNNDTWPLYLPISVTEVWTVNPVEDSQSVPVLSLLASLAY